MSNMSYCRFRNTNQDLTDCAETIKEAGSLIDLDLSREEFNAMIDMLATCRDLMERYSDELEDIEIGGTARFTTEREY